MPLATSKHSPSKELLRYEGEALLDLSGWRFVGGSDRGRELKWHFCIFVESMLAEIGISEDTQRIHPKCYTVMVRKRGAGSNEKTQLTQVQSLFHLTPYSYINERYAGRPINAAGYFCYRRADIIALIFAL